MIKCLLKVGSGNLVILGLTGKDMARLLDEEQVFLNLKELNLPEQEILILGGKDETSIQDFILERIAEAIAEEEEESS